MDQVEEVKQKTDIVSLIGEHITLQKAGRNYKANCPFHSERTPSFMVNSELQIFKCFGCSESGDAITFLQKHEDMDFPEALKFLADKAGVKLVSRPSQDSSEKQKLHTLNKLAADYYHYILTKHALGKPALSYLLKDRNITDKSIQDFCLGFAPDNPTALSNFLVQKKGFNHKDLIKAGLSISTRSGLIDRFYGRVIFPLFDHRGNSIGLTGRLLPSDKRTRVGKYINSPDSPVYHKSSVLYGLNITRREIKRSQKAIVVEGDIDLISSIQAGVTNVVAIKGTALTSQQAQVLVRIAPEIILALDADVAGDSAARRGIEVAQSAGLDVKVVVLKDYKDPDEFAQKDPSGYQRIFSKAVGVWDFLISSTLSKHDLSKGHQKARASREIIDILASISDEIVKAHYVNLTASQMGVPRESVIAELSKHTQTQKAPEVLIPETVSQDKKTRKQILEERLLLLSLQKGSLAGIKWEPFISTPVLERIFEQLQHHLQENNKLSLSQFQKNLPAEIKKTFSDLLLTDEQEYADPTKLALELKNVVNNLDLIVTKDKMQGLAQEISKYEKEGDKKSLKEAKTQFSNLSKYLSDLED